MLAAQRPRRDPAAEMRASTGQPVGVTRAEMPGHARWLGPSHPVASHPGGRARPRGRPPGELDPLARRQERL